MSVDLLSALGFQLVENIQTVANTTDVVTAIVDTQGLNGLVFVIITGTITATAANTFAVLVEYGDQSNLSDAAAVPDAELNGTEALAGFTGADDNELRIIGVQLGGKRYIRLTVDMANNDGDVPISILAVKLPTSRPAVNPPA